MGSVAKKLTADDNKRINEAVAAAESKTSAEIVPVVAAVSGRYDRPEDIVGLWVAVLALAVTWCLLPEHAGPGDWGAMPAWAHLLVLILAVVVGFVVGAVIGAHFDPLRHLFTPAQQMRDEVFIRSRQVFFDSRVHHTMGRTGLLIYVSLFERMAAVLADDAVVEKLGQAALDELCDQLMASLRTKSLADAICGTIAAAAPKLAAALPRAEGDINELPDALVILDRAV
jgi:putative membrane protein